MKPHARFDEAAGLFELSPIHFERLRLRASPGDDVCAVCSLVQAQVNRATGPVFAAALCKRTGSAAAIGAKYLARKTIDAVGVIGTGRIGRASLLCVAEVRDFDRVYSFSGRKKDEVFAQSMSRMLRVDVVACDSNEEVVRKSNLLVTATYAQKPVISGEWLSEGTHISGMGADGPMKLEMDPITFKRANRVVVDSEKCLSIGEMAQALDSGALNREEVDRIGDVVAGKKPGRISEKDITIFESDGTIIQSAAVVQLIYKKAVELGLGVDTGEVYSFFMNP